LVTLPVLLFLEEDPDHPAVCRALQGNSTEEVVREAVQAVTASMAIKRALEVARGHAELANEALNGLPDSSYRTALSDLADFTVRRRF
jgi:geranylgeranyl pyrophosphate synthase